MDPAPDPAVIRPDRRWQRHRWTIIAGDNDTGDKFIAGDKNKDAMEVRSSQG